MDVFYSTGEYKPKHLATPPKHRASRTVDGASRTRHRTDAEGRVLLDEHCPKCNPGEHARR